MTSIAVAKLNWNCAAGVNPRHAFRRQVPGCGVYPNRLRYTAGRRQRKREIDGRHYVLEYPIKADYALIKAHQADRWGNLVYRKAARNFGPIMATAAKTTVAEVSNLVTLGELDPENIIHPGDFRSARLLAGKSYRTRAARIRSLQCKNCLVTIWQNASLRYP